MLFFNVSSIFQATNRLDTRIGMHGSQMSTFITRLGTGPEFEDRPGCFRPGLVGEQKIQAGTIFSEKNDFESNSKLKFKCEFKNI